MSPGFFALSVAGPCLEALLVWRLFKHRTVFRYPYFSAYIICDALFNFLLLILAALQERWFAYAYWAAEVASLLTGFLIVWEVVRVLFPPDSSLRGLARSILLLTGAVALPAFAVLAWSQSNLIHFTYRYVPPVFEQYLSLAEAVLLLALAATALYYRLPLGRNQRGLVFGFGLYLSLCAVNFASLQIVPGFLTYWQFISPVLYIGLLSFCLWAFWNYSPVPGLAAIQRDQSQRKEHWNQLWAAAMAAVKRGSN